MSSVIPVSELIAATGSRDLSFPNSSTQILWL